MSKFILLNKNCALYNNINELQIYMMVSSDFCLDTIEASINYPDWRVEIFTSKNSKYLQSYSYYKNGNLVLVD